MVRVVRLERTVSWSQTRRDTNFAIPGYSLFCHDTTASGKNKDFSVCGHSCGQSCFCAALGNRWKSRKRRRRKAFRRFTLPRPGYSHGTPKPGAIHQLRYTRIKIRRPLPGGVSTIPAFSPACKGKICPVVFYIPEAFSLCRITAPAPPSARPPDRSFPKPRPGPPGPCGRRPPAYGRWAFADPDHG